MMLNYGSHSPTPLTLGRLQFLFSLSYRSDWCLVNFLVLFFTIFGLLAGVRAILPLKQVRIRAGAQARAAGRSSAET